MKLSQAKLLIEQAEKDLSNAFELTNTDVSRMDHNALKEHANSAHAVLLSLLTIIENETGLGVVVDGDKDIEEAA